jgi:chromosome segregation ATPase
MHGIPVRPMPATIARLRAIHDHVARLIREHEVLRQRAAELETELNDGKRSIEVLKARVAELERDNEVLRKARPADGGPGPTGTKEKIDELVQEIDQCLALLSAGSDHH